MTDVSPRMKRLEELLSGQKLSVLSTHSDFYVTQTGLRERILLELSRKRFDEMRWEEIWDVSLRIRNMFLKRYGNLSYGSSEPTEQGPVIRLPCVTGVPDATRLIQTGNTLTVNGYLGIVIVHKN